MDCAESSKQNDTESPGIAVTQDDLGVQPKEMRAFADNWRWIGACVLVFALLMYPIVRRVTSTTAPGIAPTVAAPPDLLALSLQYYQAKRYPEAVAASKAFLEINPKSADAYNNLGIAWGGLGQWAPAVASLEAALRLNPDHQLAKNNLAWVTGEMRKISPQQKTAEYYLNQSAAEFRANKFKEALASARQCLHLRPDDADAYNNIAVSNIRLLRYDEAVQSAQTALRLRPDFALARNNMVWALAEKRKASRAEPANR